MLDRREVDAQVWLHQAPAMQAALEQPLEHHRLLGDLLGHEAVVAALAHRLGGDLDGREARRHLGAGAVPDRHALLPDVGDLAILQVHRFMGVGQQGRQVGRQQQLLLAAADQDGAAIAGGEQAVGMVGEHRGEGELAAQPRQRGAHGGDRIAGVEAGEQLGDDLGVGLAEEAHASGLQLGAQLLVVLDDAVVDHRDAPVRAHMGVGIDLGGGAMGGPAGVGDAPMRADGMAFYAIGEVLELAGGLAHLDRAVGEHRQAGGVIAAVLEPLEGDDQHLIDVLRSDVACDPAHVRSLISYRSMAIMPVGPAGVNRNPRRSAVARSERGASAVGRARRRRTRQAPGGMRHGSGPGIQDSAFRLNSAKPMILE